MITAFDVCFLVNVERKCELTVTLEPGAFFVTRQRFGEVALARLGCKTSHLLLLSLALTSNEDLMSASLFFLASSGSVANGLIRVATSLLGLTTRLLARSTASIFAVAFTMAGLGTEVRATLELPATDLTTADVFQPALLVLETLLSTHAMLLNQERTSGTALIVHMTVVLDLRMAASFGSVTLEAAWWRLSTARKWGSQHCTATVAVDLVKDGFATRSTRSLMAEVLTEVVSTLERSTTWTSADMLSLKAVIDGSNVCIFQLTALTLHGLSFTSLPLTFATAFIASMTTTVQGSSAYSHTLRRLNLTLMADCSGGGPAATAADRNSLETRHTSARVTQLLARVSTRELLHAWLLAVCDGVLTRSASIR